MSSIFGMPSTGGNAPQLKLLGANQGLFAVPLGVQRVYEYDLFSTVRLVAGGALAQTSRLFVVGLNSQGQGFANPLTVSETNMTIGAIAPGNETYEVSAIACEVYGSAAIAPTPGDLRLIQRIGVLAWEFGSTTILYVAPISMIGAGGGIFGMTADTGTPITVANNGNGGLWVYVNIVVAIPATQAFAMQVQWGNGGTGASIAPVAEVQLRVSLFNQARSAVPNA